MQLVVNPRPERGLATSLQVAVAAARELGASAIVVGLADQPGLRPEAWSAVAASTAAVAVGRYRSRRGHPIRLSAEVWDRLPYKGDVGARELFDDPDLDVAEIPVEGDPRDIDTVEDLRSWIDGVSS